MRLNLRNQLFDTFPLRSLFVTGLCVLFALNADVTTCYAAPAPSETKKPAPGKKPVPAAARPTLPASATQLVYNFVPGASARFKLTALFDGHFPPFAQPGSPAIHIKADIVYVATVKKVDKEGATVDFNVESRELSLIDHEAKDEERIDDKTITDLPIVSLEDVQKALNASALLRPDGSIAKILNTSSVKVLFDVGFDIRKMFLVMLPITFANQPVKVGDTWAAQDGLLGMKAGRTTYTNKLTGITPDGRATAFRLNQTASSQVEDKLDKSGNSTANAEEVYRTLSGKVDLTSEMTFLAVGPVASSAPNAKAQPGQVKKAHLVMNAVLDRKRVKINPDQPEIPESDPIDVKARMTVEREDAPVKAAKPADKTAQK